MFFQLKIVNRTSLNRKSKYINFDSMKMILDIPEAKSSFFEELVKNFNYVNVIKVINDPKKGEQVLDLVNAFNDVKLHEQGKKKLKTAKEFFSEV